MAEGAYKRYLRRELERRFPGCMVIKLDPSFMPGLPDMLILFNDRWAVLEAKVSARAKIQPNQPYYVELLGRMSFAAFIYPENEEVIFGELEQALQPDR